MAHERDWPLTHGLPVRQRVCQASSRDARSLDADQPGVVEVGHGGDDPHGPSDRHGRDGARSDAGCRRRLQPEGGSARSNLLGDQLPEDGAQLLQLLGLPTQGQVSAAREVEPGGIGPGPHKVLVVLQPAGDEDGQMHRALGLVDLALELIPRSRGRLRTADQGANAVALAVDALLCDGRAGNDAATHQSAALGKGYCCPLRILHDDVLVQLPAAALQHHVQTLRGRRIRDIN
mmetsp:Transcript_95463/g.285034  ORF Transcript_95463/g.285034 Transcript_95463/m.285034 type:complete len:233 (-) Transcript_95463:120-818(-)|eukprot:CAMPEP_0175197322 /NCGR_PEP_ID=MMETSP0093-20121207/7958_1 /TAXON_ID=311494 /ORGANISM="Alexandrium monilatum, Strain CCMP3105" /LENGTH=232 /DNA_ID=CAMNT_0016490293 /DNA_START=438 /DNA_END=1136 /DNA_ORIENTATION=+